DELGRDFAAAVASSDNQYMAIPVGERILVARGMQQLAGELGASGPVGELGLPIQSERDDDVPRGDVAIRGAESIVVVQLVDARDGCLLLDVELLVFCVGLEVLDEGFAVR